MLLIRPMKGGVNVAIRELVTRKALKMEFDAGIVEGKQKFFTKTLNNVNQEATNQSLHSTALAMSGLVSKDIINISKQVTTQLWDE